ALVAAVSEHGDPVAKVTILPAGQALGVTEQLPIDERHLYTEGYLKDSPATRMGGRVAEQLVFGQTSTGAANDLAGATDLATRMVREFGMSPALGPVGFASGSPMYLGTEEVRRRPYAAPMPSPPSGWWTRRWPSCCGRPRSGPWPCWATTGTPWTGSPTCCWSARRATGTSTTR